MEKRESQFFLMITVLRKWVIYIYFILRCLHIHFLCTVSMLAFNYYEDTGRSKVIIDHEQ